MITGSRIRLILNPASGAERGKAVADQIRSAILELGPEQLDLSLTTGPDDASDWAQEAARDGFNLIIAAGGDGTVAAIARGILKSGHKAAIGIIPLGTGNGLARVLGIQTGMQAEPLQSVRALARGKLVALDVLDVPSHDAVSLLFMGAGLDAEINRDASPQVKARLGFLAYVGAAFANVLRRRNHQIRMVVEGEERQLQAHTVSLFNATRLQIMGNPVGPDAQPHDGWAELSVMTDPGPFQVAGQVLRIISGPTSRPGLEGFRTLELEADPPMPVHIDGDLIGETPLSVRLLPGALQFVASEKYVVPH